MKKWKLKSDAEMAMEYSSVYNPIPFIEKTMKKTTKQITNIRYGKLGEIKFDFRRKTYSLREPEDVILVGSPNILAQRYIARKIISGKTTVDVNKLKKVV